MTAIDRCCLATVLFCRCRWLVVVVVMMVVVVVVVARRHCYCYRQGKRWQKYRTNLQGHHTGASRRGSGKFRLPFHCDSDPSRLPVRMPDHLECESIHKATAWLCYCFPYSLYHYYIITNIHITEVIFLCNSFVPLVVKPRSVSISWSWHLGRSWKSDIPQVSSRKNPSSHIGELVMTS